MDELRERIARALWESDREGTWENAGDMWHGRYRERADAVIAALGLTEDWDEDCWDGGSIPIRRWTTPWERIEEDG